jgi:hypothetical protein
MNAKNVGTKFDRHRKDDGGGKDRDDYVYRERMEIFEDHWVAVCRLATKHQDIEERRRGGGSGMIESIL